MKLNNLGWKLDGDKGIKIIILMWVQLIWERALCKTLKKMKSTIIFADCCTPRTHSLDFNFCWKIRLELCEFWIIWGLQECSPFTKYNHLCLKPFSWSPHSFPPPPCYRSLVVLGERGPYNKLILPNCSSNFGGNRKIAKPKPTLLEWKE